VGVCARVVCVCGVCVRVGVCVCVVWCWCAWQAGGSGGVRAVVWQGETEKEPPIARPAQSPALLERPLNAFDRRREEAALALQQTRARHAKHGMGGKSLRDQRHVTNGAPV